MTPNQPLEGLIDVTVPVPQRRLAEFYRLYAGWLGETSTGATEGLRTAWEAITAAHGGTTSQRRAWDASDQEQMAPMAELWGRSSEGAKALFTELMRDHTVELSVDDLAQRLGVERSAVTGTLSWPVRIARDLGFASPIVVTRVADGIFCRLDAQAAQLLSRVIPPTAD